MTSTWLALLAGAIIIGIKPVEASGFDINCRSSKVNTVNVVVHACRIGDLLCEAGSIQIGTPTQKDRYGTYKANQIGGYYYMHDKLLIYINDTMADDLAVLDLTYDFQSNHGSMTLRRHERNEAAERPLIYQGPITCQ